MLPHNRLFSEHPHFIKENINAFICIDILYILLTVTRVDGLKLVHLICN